MAAPVVQARSLSEYQRLLEASLVSEAVHYERVREHLEALKLHAALAELDPLLEATAKEERGAAWLLDQLLTRERDHRFERRVAANLKLSGIPSKKTLDQFDFEAQPSVPRHTLDELATLRFLARARTSSSSAPPASARRTSPWA